MKTLIISGGSKGIGKAIIKKFASQGFAIATYARNKDLLEKLELELKAEHASLSFYAEALDASDKKAVIRFAANALQQMGGADVLVNNAGIFTPGQVLNEEDGTLEKQFNINVASAYHLSRGIAPHMQKQKDGHIFNICSTASIMPYTNGGSYCISKFALLGMSKVLREELKEHGVRVTSVLPGATYTDSWSGTELPPERFMKAEDVAEAIWATYALSRHTVVEELLLRPQLGDIS